MQSPTTFRSIPEDKTDIPHLVRYYQSIYSEGFRLRASADSDEKVRVKPVFNAAHGVELDEIDHNTRITPVDYLVREAQNRERIDELVQAEQVLAGLRLGAQELSVLLEREVRDEASLQRTLTKWPVLLGLDYRQIIPKHSLGGEYELDYAAITVNGFVHCIEIEPSNLPLYTKAGNPKAELVHAEQQVLDWLDWLDRHFEYASRTLPSLLRPTGTVVMGRRSDLSELDRKRLERRNVSWAGTLRVLTYDDLIDQALATVDWLTRDAAPTP